MKTYHVGGLNPIRRFKTFSEALAQAKNDDTIEIHKNLLENVLITKNIIIKGNNNTWTTPIDKIAIDAKAPIEISDLTIKVPTRSIGLNIATNSELSNIKIIQEGPIREFYPTIQFLDGTHKIYDSELSSIQSDGKTTMILDNVTLKSYYPADVLLRKYDDMNAFYGQVQAKNCTIASTRFIGESQLDNCTVNRHVNVEGNSLIKNLSFDIKIPQLKKNWAKKEPDNGPLRDQLDLKYGLLIYDSEVRIDNYSISNFEKGYSGFYGLNSQITLSNVKIEDLNENAVHTLINSSITFEDSNDSTFWYLDNTKASYVRSKINSNATHETAKEKLDKMIGLQSVKAKIESMVNTIELNRKSNNTDFSFSYNMVFAGDPGTGKTVVARIIAETLFEIGAIPENKFTTATSDTFVKGYVGQSGENTRKILESALGGVLFIDEAYELADTGHGNSFNSEVISVLIRYMEDHRDDLVVIAAGYSKEMKDFFASNPGLARRFNWIEFDDYSSLELSQIFESIRESYEDSYETELLGKLIPQLFEQLTHYNLTHPDPKGRVTNGGNGGLVRNVYQSIVESRNNRVMTTGGTTNLTQDDIIKGFSHEAKKAKLRLESN